jgi:hypothetical protein
MTPEDWIRAHVEPTAEIELASEEPWSTVLRVPVDGGVVWFKHCKSVWSFEPRLAATLARRWPDRVTEVIAHDDELAWLLTRDAGTRIGERDPAWIEVMCRYAELQQGEIAHADEHVAAGVPDLRLATLPQHYARLVARVGDERLRAFAPRFAELCDELASYGIPDTIQHDDLHQYNVYVRDGTPRIHDWGDSCVSQPYFSLVATLRHVDDLGISNAFLDAWGADERTVALALRVGRIAHALKGLRQLDAIGPGDEDWPRVLALAVAQTSE